MSDRWRRWLCQLVFIAVCVLPTAWVLLRIAYQPGPAHFAQQLQLQLGVPVSVERVTTPTPDLTLLHQVKLRHPETGTWAEADRWALIPGTSLAAPRWRIEHLSIQEASLGDFFEQLHNTVVRQRLSTVGQASQAVALPTIHVHTLEVVPAKIDEPRTPATASPVALRLKDVAITWQVNPQSHLPRLELAAKVTPPRRDRDLLSTGMPQPEIPLLCYLERIPTPHSNSHRSSHVTQWELAALDRPVPMAWLNFASWPPFIRQRSEVTFQGLLSGRVVDNRWWVSCHQTRLEGLDLSDLEFFLTGQRTQNQAPVRLQIQELGWSGLVGGAAQWEACDVDLHAGIGELAGWLVQYATQALDLPHTDSAVRLASFVSNAAPNDAIGFAEMNVGVRLRDGQLLLRPLDSASGPLPVLGGFNKQEQIAWPNRGERVWRVPAAEDNVTRVHHTDTQPDTASSAAPYQHEPLEIAPVELHWEPNQFVVGVPMPDRFFDQTITEPRDDDAPLTTSTMRAIIEHPGLATLPDASRIENR